MSRILTVAEAINEAQQQLLESSRDYFIIGEGVGNDPKGCFGTVTGLKEKFPDRVWDMPVSENGMTGVCVGAAVAGMRPIMVHMRADFLLYAADQIINNAAKWRAMFGGKAGSCPLVIRAVIGRGWGQGVQHSQHLEALFARVSGLTVLCPSNALDAKGMLIWAARQDKPVLFMEHRWIHELKCEVPEEMYEVARSWKSVFKSEGPVVHSLYSWGYMVHECVQAGKFLAKQNINVNVIDMRGPSKMGALNEADYVICEDSMCPPSSHLSKDFYPSVKRIMQNVAARGHYLLNCTEVDEYEASRPHDIPNPDFRGPF